MLIKNVKTVLESAKEKVNLRVLYLQQKSLMQLQQPMPHMSILVIKDEIAKQFYNDKINGKHKVDVILGGGSKYFGKE